MSALLATFGVFAMILILTRLKVPLPAAVLVGSAALGLSMGLGARQVASAMAAGLVEPRTVALVVVTVLLLALSQAMQAGGQFEQIVAHTRALLRRPAVAMAALPAIIGLLPMPGGALFSAPMVAAAAGKDEPRGEVLSAVNYWFRHVWEHWWPLYPGVILAMELTERTPRQFVPIQLPLGLFMAASGLLILRRVHPSLRVTAPPAPAGTAGKLLRSVSSILVILLVWAAGGAAVGLLWPGKPQTGLQAALRKFAPFAAALVLSIAWTVRLNRMGRRDVAAVFRQTSLYRMGALVAVVMVFQFVLAHTGAPGRIAVELRQLHVPLVAVVCLLPFVGGMVTGLAIGFVGTSFPILIPLVAGAVGAGAVPAYAALAYGFGHLGQMLSPLHICHVVSNEYFGTTFRPVYRQLVPSALATAGASGAYFLLLRLTGL